MVADEVPNTESDGKLRIPAFDEEDPLSWKRDMTVFLRIKNRAHLGLKAVPALKENPNETDITQHRQLVDAWEARNDTAYAYIMTSVRSKPTARQVADTYDEAPNSRQSAEELMALLVTRFTKETQTTIEDWIGKYNSFSFKETELPTHGIDRFKDIVQKLGHLGAQQSEVSQVERIKSALLNDSRLVQLTDSMAVLKNLTLEDLCAIVKRWEDNQKKKKQQQRTAVLTPATVVTPTVSNIEDMQKCFYCNKVGHVQKDCHRRKRELSRTLVKKAIGRSDLECHRCGKKGHVRKDCRVRLSNDDSEEQRTSNHKRRKSETRERTNDSKNNKVKDKRISKYLNIGKSKKGGEANFLENSESESIDMIEEEDDTNDFVSSVSAEDQLVFIDSCASQKLFIVASADYLQCVDSTVRSGINLTKKSAVMEVTGTGSHGDWLDVKVCPESRKNICSTSRLQAMGYGLILLDKVEIVRLDNRAVVLSGQLIRGMPCVSLEDLWRLRCLTSEVNNLSDKIDVDELDLLHDRAGHFNNGALIEGHKRLLFTGSGLKAQHLRRKVKRCLCSWCARAKITRVSFRPREEPCSTVFGEYIVADIAVYLNCPSMEGIKYVLQFTCVATKWFYSYGLVNRTGDDVLRCLVNFVEVQLIKFPGDHKVRRYHADGGKELIDQRVVQYIERRGGDVTYSSTATPELNGIAERKYRTSGEMALTMLIRSGLPKGFWWKAYVAARYVLLRLPTRTYKGYMTPLECVPGGSVPSLKRLRVWGCKAYMLVPGNSRRKDWEDKAWTGYFVGYSESKAGWTVYLPEQEKEETSVHVLFDEKIPSRPEEYFAEIDQLRVKVSPEERTLEEFGWLKDTYHMDSGLLYKTNRVVIRKGVIVAYRSLVTAGRSGVEDKVPIHVADVVVMTQEFLKKTGGDVIVESEEVATPRYLATMENSKGTTHPTSRPSGLVRCNSPTSSPAESEIKNASRLQRVQDVRMSRSNTDSVVASTGEESSGQSHINPCSGDACKDVTRASGQYGGLAMFGGDPACKRSYGVGETGAAPLTVPDMLHRRSSGRLKPRKPLNVSVLGEIHNVEEFYFLPQTERQEIHQLGEALGVNDLVVPRNKREVEMSDQRVNWVEALSTEIDNVDSRGTMDLVPEPQGTMILPSHMVYSVKKDHLGKPKRFKARWVVDGNYDTSVAQTFAPVVKGITIRLIIAIAFIMSLHIHQLDITNAFCYADVEGDVFIKAPKELDIPSGYCFKLKKSLYGLKTSPRSWNKHINRFIKSLGFSQCVLDTCLYYKFVDGKIVLLALYVDDILIASADVEYIREIKNQFCKTFDMTDMGELHHFLNIRITRTTTSIKMDQSVYASKVVEKFAPLMGSLRKTRKCPLPDDAADRLTSSEELSDAEKEYISMFPFKEIIGALLHLSIHTRPDITYAVGVLSRYSTKVTLAACEMCVHVLQYIRGTVDNCIIFSGSKFDLHVFTDADWAGDRVTRRSTTGYIVFAGGGPIIWSSKLQTTVATSSMESEYMAMYGGMQELVWIRGVLSELSLTSLFSKSTPFYIDSQSAEDLALNPVYHKRSKHISIKYHWIREHVDPEGLATARLYHVCSEDQVSDIFTKIVTGLNFEKHEKTITGKRRSETKCVEVKNPVKRQKRN